MILFNFYSFSFDLLTKKNPFQLSSHHFQVREKRSWYNVDMFGCFQLLSVKFCFNILLKKMLRLNIIPT